MKDVRKTSIKTIVLRVALTLLCGLTYAWIFSNSLRSGEQSSHQSQGVTEAVQEVAKIVAPNSFVATASGNDYERLHAYIRTFAHFSEFALLGALLIFCYFSYTRQKAFLIVPAGLILLTPLTDEWLQMFTSARAAEISDVIVDSLGGVCGAVFALSALGICALILRRRAKKRAIKNAE